MKKREELVIELNKIQDLEKDLHLQIQTLDYEKNLSEVNVFLGKYYQNKNEHHPECIRCIWVYGIEPINCELNSIEVHYWSNKNDWYNIQNNTTFNPKRWEDDYDQWDKITKEDFLPSTPAKSNLPLTI